MFNWLTLNQANSRRPILAQSWLLRRKRLNARAISPLSTMEVSAISVLFSFVFNYGYSVGTWSTRDYIRIWRWRAYIITSSTPTSHRIYRWNIGISPLSSWWPCIQNFAWILRIDSYFSGFKNKDVAFFHKESKSLIEADLLLNLPCNEQVKSNSLSFMGDLTAYTTASIQSRQLLQRY